MTQDDIIRMAHEAGLHLATDVNWMPIIDLKYAEKFAALVAAAERSACAQVCDEIANKPSNMVLGVALDCAAAIRARGREMTQPEALRLADEMERVAEYDHQVQAAAELRRLHEVNQVMLNTLRWIDKLCPDEFHYFDKQKPGLQRVLAKMAYDAGGLARSTIEKVEEI